MYGEFCVCVCEFPGALGVKCPWTGNKNEEEDDDDDDDDDNDKQMITMMMIMMIMINRQ